jgi:hypothetical protein
MSLKVTMKIVRFIRWVAGDCLLSFVAILLGGTFAVSARVGALPISSQSAVLPVANVQQVALLSVDPAAELARDAKAGSPGPMRFAFPQAVVLTPTNSGTWEQLPEGRLWRLRVTSKGATDLNFGFTQFWLPEGASLYVLSEGNGYYQGPYTARENTSAGELWTPVIPGEAGIIELYVPTAAREQPRLMLTQVGAGYRDLFGQGKDVITPNAASCEIDVACPPAAPWTNEVRSVARIQIAGTNLCSGTLIMDAPRDFRAFFLTANHCGITPANAASVVVYWNDQSPTCGQYGSGGLLLQNQTGATFRAAKTDVDFCLIELNQLPPAAYRVYYAGWDRSGTAPAGGIGIHHPRGDGKCISLSTNPLTTADSCGGTGGNNTHWLVSWTSGITETGSSGSGIWDPATHKLVGTLTGGDSSCSTPTSPDCYGKFSVAWDSGTQATNRLRDWLDPRNTGITAVAGSDQAPAIIGITITNRAPQLTIRSPSGISNQIQYSTNLSQTQWSVLTNLLVGQSLYQVVDPGAPSSRQRFYRVADTTTFVMVTLLQLWGSSNRTNLATALVQQSSTPTPVNTSLASFDAAHTKIWIPVSYVPNWAVGTQVYWGSSLYKMRVEALGAGQIQFRTLSGYFGWGAGNVISPTLSYTLSSVMTAALNWKSPGVGNTVIVTAAAISATAGDVVWVGGVGGDQFQIVAISH